jgi:antirestriction protein ArdC
MTTTPTTAEARQARTDETAAKAVAHIVAALEAGTVDPNGWRAPWNASAHFLSPVNAVTQRPYTGGNRWILATMVGARGYTENRWATFNQWRDAGCKLTEAKGMGVPILRPRIAKVTDQATGLEGERIVGWAAHYVFNVAHVVGAPAGPVVETPEPVTGWADDADDWFDAVGRVVPTFHDGRNRAYYVPALDRVHLPERDAFTSADGYYSTRAHEYGHSTGHDSRLARTFGRFGDATYAAEELCAELTAALVMAHLGRSAEPRPDHAQYLANWLKALKAEPSMLFTVAGKAERALAWLVETAERHLPDVTRARETWAARPELVNA